MENANNIRVGNIITHQNKLWRVARTQHTMPGKGGAFIQMELRDIVSGTKLNERFRSSEGVETVQLDQKDMQYLFADDQFVTLMDMETYEQVALNREIFDDQIKYLQDGMKIIVEFYEGTAVSVELPEHVVLTIAETEAVVKGQTATSTNKPAILENGVRTTVPTFIASGDRVMVKTVDGSYFKRAE